MRNISKKLPLFENYQNYQNMKREKSKLELWIERYLKLELFADSVNTGSRYYRINTRIVRISDHISNSSDGDLSVILDSHDTEHFIVHAVRTGEISVLNYKELKELLRSLRLLPALTNVANSKESQNILPKDATKGIKQIIIDPHYVCGIHIGYFKTSQQQAIYGMVNKASKKVKV